MYKFVEKAPNGWWLEIPPMNGNRNPIFDVVKINQMDDRATKLNMDGLYIYVNKNGGWHTGNGEEVFDNIKYSKTL